MSDRPMPVRRPFYDTLGIEVLQAQDGCSRVRMAADPRLANGRGDVHGGAIAGLLDAALSTAARSSLPPGHGTATITISTSFLIPGRGMLAAEGRVTRSGRSIVAAEAEGRDSAGTLIAQALGTLRALRPE